MKNSTLMISAILICGAVLVNGYLNRRAADTDRVEFMARCTAELNARFSDFAEKAGGESRLSEERSKDSELRRRCEEHWYYTRHLWPDEKRPPN